MALLLTALTTSPGLPGAGNANYPLTRVACANAWAAAAQSWAAAIVPASTTVAAAATTLATALDAAFGGANPAAVASAMEAAFAAFAVTVGGGMAGFVPTPPPSPVGFAALFSGSPVDRQAGVNVFSSAIDTWMRTGSSVPSGGGSPVPWT